MSDPSLDIASLGGHTMGTSWSVRIATRPGRDLHPLYAGIQARLDDVVAQMSTWEPGSDISRFNQAAAGHAQPLPDAFSCVLQAAVQVASESDGAFDPTVSPLVALWGFGAHAGARHVPDDATLQRVRALCGWQRVAFDAQQRLLQPGGLQLDLSAIAKGFAVDHVSRWLRGIGMAAALVEVGGELHGFGRKPDGSPWRVLVESSPDEDAGDALPPRVIVLDELAVATSGDRWHRFEIDGHSYSHTLDPRSGRPVDRSAAAVTVVAASAMQADAWATALTVLGVDDGIALANARGLAARFVQRTPEGPRESLSAAFSALLDGATP